MKDQIVSLNHGAGGEAMRRFIEGTFVDRFDNPSLRRLEDAAVITANGLRLAFTTDSYVIKPLEFPGGDIGKLSVCGTVNDLAVMGAKPLFISMGFIIEEGLDLGALEKFVASAAETARSAQVEIVTGDTKVVPRGECDGLFINTSGIGLYPMGQGLCQSPIKPGDAILVSGTVGDHAIAILAARENLQFETHILSDCAPLNGLLSSVLQESAGVKWMRDPTRGGVAAVFSELVQGQPFGVLIQESKIPVRDEVRAVCELLGFDPLHLANEGKAVLVVEIGEAERVLHLLQNHLLGRQAAIIGQITGEAAGKLRAETLTGGIRLLHRPVGELLPRIC